MLVNTLYVSARTRLEAGSMCVLRFNCDTDSKADMQARCCKKGFGMHKGTYRVQARTSLPPLGHAPAVGLSGKTGCTAAVFSRGNGKNRSKTNDYLLRLKAVELESVPFQRTRGPLILTSDQEMGILTFICT